MEGSEEVCNVYVCSKVTLNTKVLLITDIQGVERGVGLKGKEMVM